MKRLIALLFSLVLLTPHASFAQDIIGDWQGTLDNPGKLRSVLKITSKPDGQLAAEFFSIDQGPDAIPVESIVLKSGDLTFSVPSVHGTYAGTLSPDGETITGTLTQGEPNALNFVRATKENAWPIDPSPHTIRFVPVEPGVDLEVLDWGGTGSPMVLLTGLGNNAHVFDKFALKLTPKYHVYAITRRGYGASDSPVPDAGNYRADRLGDDVLAVLDAIKIEHPILVGHSVAGEELSSVGSRFPDRVAGLIYLDAGYTYALYDPAQADFEMDVTLMHRDLDAFYNAISPQQRRKALSEIQQELPQFSKSLAAGEKQLAGMPDMSPEDLAKFEKQVKSAPHAMVTGRAIIDGIQPYTEIKCPVLAIFAEPHQQGSKPDPTAEAKDIAQVEPRAHAFETLVPQAKVVRIPQANHYVFRSNEADVLREIDAFTATLK